MMGIAALIFIVTGFLCIFCSIIFKIRVQTRIMVNIIGTVLCAIGIILAYID